MLDDVTPESATNLIEEANNVVEQQVVTHERNDEGKVLHREVVWVLLAQL